MGNIEQMLLQEVNKLNAKIDSVTVHALVDSPTRSAQLNHLFTALAKAQAEMEAAELDCKNPYFNSRYSTLHAITKASRPYLTKHGLAVLQIILPMEHGRMLVTVLGHGESGQFITSQMPINPPKTDIQSLGSYIQYLRRYCYAAMVGIVSSDETDDDGEATMVEARKTNYTPPNEKITSEQIGMIKEALEDHVDLLKTILDGAKVSKLEDIQKNDFTRVFNWIQKMKNIKMEGKK